MHLSTKHPTRVCQTWGPLVIAALVGTVGLWHVGQAAEFSCAASDVACLIDAITTANANGEGNTITLAAGTYTLTAVDHDTEGPTGLPAITSALTLRGSGAQSTIIERAASTPRFRLLHVAATGLLTLEGLTLRGGDLGRQQSLGGGGIHNHGILTITQSTLSDNTASYGGGIHNDGILTITQSTLRHNRANSGGGLNHGGPTLAITASTLSDNTARYGGGIYSSNYSSLTIANSTLQGNVADSGGGISLWRSSVHITNGTVSDNVANSGGGIAGPIASVTMQNTILARNSVPPTRGWPDCAVPFMTSQGHNLLGDPSGCPISLATSDLTGDPGVGDFVDDGTPGRGHVPLLPGSRAIDAIPWGTNGCGTTVYSDQRGQARPQPAGGACDIGAYEVTVAGQPLSAWVTGLTPHTAVCENVTTGQAVTLSAPTSPWDCEAAGLAVRAGDQVALRVRGPVTHNATDVGGAVVGLAPRGGGCTNRTTGQAVTFQHMVGATAASCGAAGLVTHPGDQVQLRVQGAAE